MRRLWYSLPTSPPDPAINEASLSKIRSNVAAASAAILVSASKDISIYRYLLEIPSLSLLSFYMESQNDVGESVTLWVTCRHLTKHFQFCEMSAKDNLIYSG